MDVIIGLDYNINGSADEEVGKGHHTIQRIGVTLHEIIAELKDILLYGSRYPQYPSSAHPEIVYAYDLNKQEDADIYPIINNELIKSMEK